MNFWDELFRPFNMASLSIAIASILLAVILFYRSQKRKRISYIKSETAYKIFDSKSSSPKIRVLDDNDGMINENIYLIDYMIWNSGDLPIEPSDIRKPLSISLSPCSKVLDHKVIQQSLPDIMNVRLIENTSIGNDRDKVINIVWDHLDPGFGTKLQVVYTGTEETINELTGYILGVSKFIDAKKQAERFHMLKSQEFFTPVIPILIIGLLVIGALELFLQTKPSPKSAISAAIVIVLLGIVGYFGTINWIRKRFKPPF